MVPKKKRITVRLTEREERKARELAKRLRFNLSELVRTLIVKATGGNSR